jgi:hypothetical protein
MASPLLTFSFFPLFHFSILSSFLSERGQVSAVLLLVVKRNGLFRNEAEKTLSTRLTFWQMILNFMTLLK